MTPLTGTLSTVMASSLLLALIFVGVPVSLSLLTAGLLGLVMFVGVEPALRSLALLPFSTVFSWVLITVPLFILIGGLAFVGGMSRQLYRVGHLWLGRLPGGLAMATVAGCALFAACSGSSVATAVTMGKIALPEMERYGYDPKLATGSVAAGGLLGILIPPSLSAVIYSLVTNESLGRVLVAGFLPGIITAILFMLTIGIWAQRIAKSGLGQVAPVTWRTRMASLKDVWGVMLIFLTVMGSIYLGIATPTEAAAAGVFVALVLAIVKSRNIRGVGDAFLSTVHTSGMIFLLLIGAGMFGTFLQVSQVPFKLAQTIVELPISPMGILLSLLALYIPLGMFLDGTSMMLVTLPIFYPIVVNLGFDGVWFGILVIKFVEIGLITPPVGLNVYAIAGIAPNVPIQDIFRGSMMFLIAELACVAIIIAFPIIPLWLPQMMRG